VAVYNPDAKNNGLIVTATANCLVNARAGYTISPVISTDSIQSVPPEEVGLPATSLTARCPNATVATGGGFKTTYWRAAEVHNNGIITSAPARDNNGNSIGWFVQYRARNLASLNLPQPSLTVYAVCATKSFGAAPARSDEFTGEDDFGQAIIGCLQKQFTTGGGFSADNDRQYSAELVTETRWAAVWSVKAYGLFLFLPAWNSPKTVWAVCVAHP
jgi:hypothetical protein